MAEKVHKSVRIDRWIIRKIYEVVQKPQSEYDSPADFIRKAIREKLQKEGAVK